MEKLKNYYEKLSQAQEEKKQIEGSEYISRVENPEGTCNTLWLPKSTSNRSATLNLNHTLLGFDEHGNLWGENGNCSTRYRIIEAPANFKNEDRQSLGEKVNKLFDNAFPSWNNTLRASNADLISSIFNQSENLKQQQDLVSFKITNQDLYDQKVYYLDTTGLIRKSKGFEGDLSIELINSTFKNITGEFTSNDYEEEFGFILI